MLLRVTHLAARPQVAIADWSPLCCSLGPSNTRRSIQLPPGEAHTAYYTLLSHPLAYNSKMPHNDAKYL